ncbi:thioredoxin-like [Poeciliopsis prolifica]|uniref:thioredoxin-like n=1 Tax=Poeciliopsis prolifica TaxID=188132 RepID=UPI002413D6A6|nr:thioredoxin-like [Poeciliopsis prolifica]
MVKIVETLEEFKKILSEAGSKLVVVDFIASWCSPCQTIAPLFEKLAEDSANKDVIFFKVDVDDAKDVRKHCGISSMPTFHFYKNGSKVHEFSGADESQLREKIQELRQ